MNSQRTKYSMTACTAAALLLLLSGCASNSDNVAAGDERAAQAPVVRCRVGYTMVCEAKKTGRIRFGTIGKENMDSCACEPEYGSTGRPTPPVIPR